MLKINFVLLLLLLFIDSNAQDTTYYDSRMVEVQSREKATILRIVTVSKDNPDAGVSMMIQKSNGKPLMEENYSSLSKGIGHGKSRRWFPNGQLASEVDFVEGKVDGKIVSYNEKGQLIREDVYKNGELVQGKCFGTDGKPVPHTNFQVLPEYPGGVKRLSQFLTSEIQYPQKQRKAGKEGVVMVAFSVLKDGTVANFTVLDSPHEDFSREALRVLRLMPRWKPGMIENRPEMMGMILPLTFTIQK